MADIIPTQIGANMLAGMQGAQQMRDAQQMNQLRGMQMQQAQDEIAREKSFRDAFSTYMQGGTNALAAMYTADPARAMQVQQFQAQQNQFARQQQLEQAKQAHAQAEAVLASDAPADYFRILFPDKAEMLAKQLGKTADDLTDEDATAIAQRVSAMAAGQAGIAPEYTQPEAGQVDGRDVFFQTDKTRGRTRVLEGVTPRPQKPLVEVSTGTKFESAAEKAYGAAEGKAFSALQELGQTSQDQNTTLRAMLTNPAITGPTQDVRAAANSFFSDLGVPIAPEKVGQIANLAQYKAMQQSTVLSEQLKQKGPQTETDRKTIQETFGNTKNVREANELVLKYKLAINDRNKVLAELAERHRQDTGKMDGWRKTIREYVDSTPLAAKNPKSNRLVFWNEFADAMAEDNPGMSDDEIMTEWRKRYATGR